MKQLGVIPPLGSDLLDSLLTDEWVTENAERRTYRRSWRWPWSKDRS